MSNLRHTLLLLAFPIPILFCMGFSGSAISGFEDDSTSIFSGSAATVSDPSLIAVDEEYVVLMEFRISKRGDVAHLYWMTESEMDNDFFTIESSEDGESFDAVAFVQGAGTSEEPREYQITDEVSGPEAIHYRLLQTSYDGESSILRQIKVK